MKKYKVIKETYFDKVGTEGVLCGYLACFGKNYFTEKEADKMVEQGWLEVEDDSTEDIE